MMLADLLWPVIAAAGLSVVLIVRPRLRPKLAAGAPLKPPARDATADEAMEDMQGHGGRKTALDDREF